MTRLTVRGEFLHIHLGLVEKLAALQRDFEVPLSSVQSVELLEHPLPEAIYELRAPPGTLLAGIATIGG